MLKILLLYFIITSALCAFGRPSANPGMLALPLRGHAAADTLLLPIVKIRTMLSGGFASFGSFSEKACQCERYGGV